MLGSQWWRRDGDPPGADDAAADPARNFQDDPFSLRLARTEWVELADRWGRTFLDHVQSPGPYHPETLRAGLAAGFAALMAGRPPFAEAVLRPLAAAHDRVLGSDHADTIRVHHYLAAALDQMEEPAEAEILFRIALGSAERASGMWSDLSNEIRRDTVLFLIRRNRQADALPLQHQVVAAVEREFGADHAETATERSTLGDLLGWLDQPREAMAAYQAALGAAQRAFGRDDARTMSIRSLLALTAGRIGDPAAEEAQLGVLVDLERVLGPGDPSTLVARSNLAWLVDRLGRADEAVLLYRAALADHRRVLGPAHPATLFTTANAAVQLWDLGRREEAVALFRELRPVAERVLGPEHEITRTSRRRLAEDNLDRPG